MKKRSLPLRVIMVGYACTVVAWPALAGADEATVPVPQTLHVPSISVVQTGSSTSATEEYIELRGDAAQAIDLSGYQLQLAHSGAADWTAPHRTIVLSGTIQSGTSVVIASTYTTAGVETKYLADKAIAWFSAGIAAKGGRARLVYIADRLQSDGSCATQSTVVDEVAWTDMPPGPSTSLQRDATSVPLVNLASSDCAPAPEVPATPASPQPEKPASGPTTPSLPAADVGLLAPQISELLPNPAAPATDAADEYIELYNPNNAVFDLSGFALKTGLNGTYTFTFAEGTLLPANGFSSFLAKDTKLVLSNSGGKAVLLDPFGTTIAQTDAYGKAAAGEAWIFANNVWQWTAQPSSGAANVVAVPAAAAPKAAAVTSATVAKKAAAKTAAKAVKSAKTTSATQKTSAADQPKTQTLATAAKPEASPLHSGVLAAAAILAVLYGAYEYRHDVANKIQQFRANRAARAALRQSTKGR